MENRQEALLETLGSRPDWSLTTCLAAASVGRGELNRWKKEEPDFLLAYNQIANGRGKAVRLRKPRQASKAKARRVLAILYEAPSLGFAAACRAEKVGIREVTEAIHADEELERLFHYALDGQTAEIEQAHLGQMKQPYMARYRADWLKQHGGPAWAGAKEKPPPPININNLNLAVLQNAPKAKQMEDGRYRPVDIPIKKLESGDRLPGMDG